MGHSEVLISYEPAFLIGAPALVFVLGCLGARIEHDRRPVEGDEPVQGIVGIVVVVIIVIVVLLLLGVI